MHWQSTFLSLDLSPLNHKTKRWHEIISKIPSSSFLSFASYATSTHSILFSSSSGTQTTSQLCPLFPQVLDLVANLAFPLLLDVTWSVNKHLRKSSPQYSHTKVSLCLLLLTIFPSQYVGNLSNVQILEFVTTWKYTSSESPTGHNFLILPILTPFLIKSPLFQSLLSSASTLHSSNYILQWHFHQSWMRSSFQIR